MALQYDFDLTNGTPLTTVYALEGNGPGNLSVPRQILQIDFGAAPFITLADNVVNRFQIGFSFNIINSGYAGSYTVGPGASTTEILSNGQLVTHVPVTVVPSSPGYNVVGVVLGAGGKWIITGPANGNLQFFPTSVFTISGDSIVGANGPYTVASSTTGNSFPVQSVVTGLNGKFIFAGDVVNFFTTGATFDAVQTGGFDAQYTIQSAAIVGPTTEVTVTGTVPVGTTVSVNTHVDMDSPNTVITVTGSIASANADGTAAPAAPANYNFYKISPITVAGTGPTYTVTFNIQGNYASQFLPGFSFLPHNITYNSLPYTNPFNITSSNYVIADNRTEIVVSVTDNTSTPAISVGNTVGYQKVEFLSNVADTDATGLVALTTYTATITVDGVAYPISILGSDAQTIATLRAQLNAQLGGDASATLETPASKFLVISSATSGSASTIAITDVDLFSSLTNIVTINAAVPGTNVSWITFPVPAIPYGYAQYTISPSSTSLELVGPGSASYNATTTWGKALQDNLIHITENFANTTAPTAPMLGQLWYDSSVPVVNAYGPLGWNALVSVVWPVQDYIDMNNNTIARLADAVTTYPYVPSLTTVGNNDQEAMNLRTSDLLYIAKTGGSSATPAVRSGTMTGSLNMNGASPIGASAIGINVNSAPISMYGTAALDFKDSGNGNITFEAATTGGIAFNATATGGINIQGIGNITVAQGNVTVGSGANYVVVQNNTGFSPTITFTTAATGQSAINMANNKIVNLFNPTNALDATNKAYVDSLVNGIIWLQPVKDPNLFDDSLTAPPVLDSTIPYHKTYIVNGVGSGAWTGLDNRAVVYDPTTTTWVDILGRVVQVGDRFGVFCEPDDDDTLVSLPAGGLTGKAGKIVTVLTVSPYTYTDYTPAEPDAFSVTGSINNISNPANNSPHFGHSYTFRGTWGTGTFGTNYAWIEFSGPQMLVDGAGLLYTGNVLNVGAGFGITANANDVQVNQTDLDTVYLRRDGTVTMTGDLNMNTNQITNLGNPAAPTDALNVQYADTRYVALAGSTMNASANITFNGGEVLGLPATPSVGGAASSKTYTDNQDALRLALAGGAMNLNANVTFSGTGEVLGLPAIPTTGGSATSKTYVDTQISTLAVDSTVVHKAGTETITGDKTFTAATLFTNTVGISGAVGVTGGANITLSGGTGELLGLPATPSVGGAATSKTYVDTQLLTKADDSLVVHLAGIETITGAKTFSAATVMNNSLTLAANGVFTNLTANTTQFSVVGTAVGGGSAYNISFTAGQNTGGIGGSSSLIAGQGSTTGGAVIITGGIGIATAGGNVTIASGAGPTSSTSGNISLTAGDAALTLQPTGVWLINSVAPSAINQAIVSNATTPATLAPSWQNIAHRVAAAPGSSAAAGNPGDFFADDSFFYVYGATGWRRIALYSF